MERNVDESEQLLLEEGKAGRLKLLGEIFTRHRDRLRRMLELRIDPRLHQRVDPSDILQETYLEASERLDGFLKDMPVPVFIWLRFLTGQKLQAIHRHHFGTKKRDARREVSLYRGAMPQATTEGLASRLLSKGSSPSDAALRAERMVRVQEALNRMKPLDRELIVLRHFEELSGAEAAQALGLNEGAARQRYVRALRKLKAILSGLPGGMS